MSTCLTPYQSQYVAWLLSGRMTADSADLLASTLVDAQVDLNPHQVEATLFAFQRPLSTRNLGYFDTEVQKLDAWADDLKVGQENEVKDVRRAATVVATLEEKLHWQMRQRDLEDKRSPSCVARYLIEWMRLAGSATNSSMIWKIACPVTRQQKTYSKFNGS